jgi:chromosome segregation ATPase
MFDYLFKSGSISPEVEKALNDTQDHVNILEDSVENLQDEVQKLKSLLTEMQLSVGILVAANQNLADDVMQVYTALKHITGISSSRHDFRFSFRDGEDDPDDDMSN